ncbi:MAG: RsmD family RNA methyltransferase [Weeksellaceae bacterium]
MLNPLILNNEVQTYLRENLSKDVHSLSLQKSPFAGIKSAELAEQIKGMKIAKSKFPFLFETDGMYYPPSLNLEQASSQATSEYKSKLVKGKTLIDFTAGLGIDAFGFAQEFEEVTALEQSSNLVEICQHNYKTMGQTNLNYLNISFETYLKENSTQNWDVIYLDPARRKNAQKKFLLEDLEPNVLEWMDEFLKRAETVVIKLSPLMDVHKIIDQIPQTQEIHLVAVKNEVKELVLIGRNQSKVNPLISAVNLETNHPEFQFHFEDEKNTTVNFSSIKTYLYEPNTALLKSGAFKLIATTFGLNKLEVNTHLYTSDELNNGFPGKIYEVIEELKEVKKSIRNQSFHVISKNYPLSVANIRKKYKLKESESQSLVFTRSIDGLLHLLCKRIY